jgi:hypothetical protein
MHIVDKIIAHLDGYEKKELLNFIERQPKVNMELKLAKIMLKDDPPKRAEIKDLLYPPNEKDAKKNRDAFNSLIKQFTDRVFLWCIITRVESDKLHFGKAYSYLILGKFLIHRNALETAKEILTIGESFATKYRDYEVLEGIYSLWMDHADSMKIPVAELIKKRESNGTTYRTKVKLQNKYALQR